MKRDFDYDLKAQRAKMYCLTAGGIARGRGNVLSSSVGKGGTRRGEGTLT